LFGRSKPEVAPVTKDIGLLGIDTKFEGSIRFTGTLRIDGTVVGNIHSEPGTGSVLIINQQATVKGDIVSDSVLISGRVEGNVHARERVEIFRSGLLKGDIHTGDIMIEGGAEFQGYCHMADGASNGQRQPSGSKEAPPVHAGESGRTGVRAEREDPARA
jgi:cytoskeletal protein CcmA (bactofilin family)